MSFRACARLFLWKVQWSNACGDIRRPHVHPICKRPARSPDTEALACAAISAPTNYTHWPCSCRSCGDRIEPATTDIFTCAAHALNAAAAADEKLPVGLRPGRCSRISRVPPFRAPSGPTAWLPPLYPYLVAGVFKWFGTYSNIATWIVLGLQCLFSALICPLVQSIGRDTFGDTVGVWSAWVWACFPYDAAIPIIIIWESSLSALLLSLILMLTLRLGKVTSLRGFLAFGALWSIAVLTSVALASLLPFITWWIWRQRKQAGLDSARFVFVALLVFFVCVAPWIIRDYQVFGQIIPVRDNFGEELWMGNRAGGTGEWVPGLHPSQNKYELEQYIRVGEIAYVAQKQREAQAYISAHPATFAPSFCAVMATSAFCR